MQRICSRNMKTVMEVEWRILKTSSTPHARSIVVCGNESVSLIYISGNWKYILSRLIEKVCYCPQVLAANILPGVVALCLIISFSEIWKNSEILDFFRNLDTFPRIFLNIWKFPDKNLNVAVFLMGVLYILDNINTALAK